MGRPKKQIHGKIETNEPTTLDQIFGDTGINKYKTLKLEEYESQLNDMNNSDLQAHAYKIGLVPVDNIKMLKGRLITEFKKHVNSFKKPKTVNKPIVISQEVKNILSEGR